MKKIFIIIAIFTFACTEEITVYPTYKDSNVLTITSKEYTEVKISGFGSVWVNGSTSVLVSRGTLNVSACGNEFEFVHDGKNKLVIECQ